MEKVFQRNELSFVSLVMRWIFGVLFFLAAVGKFYPGPVTAFGPAMAGGFKDTILPYILVLPYAAALPFVELAIGVLLLAGLFTRPALAAAALLLLSLALGMMIKKENGVAAANFTYTFMAALAFLFAKWNDYSLDYLLKRKPLSPGL